MAFYGLLLFIAAEFIDFLLGNEGKLKPLLRQGNKIIYAYALYLVALSVHTVVVSHEIGRPLGVIYHTAHLVIYSLLAGIRVLIWIVISITLKKTLSIIEESKTLV